MRPSRARRTAPADGVKVGLGMQATEHNQEQAAAERPDVLVIGGGPAGSTAATLLARKGWRVAMLEKARHPRFHIGESLLPMNLPILERLGVLDQVRAIGVAKYGADFPLDAERWLRRRPRAGAAIMPSRSSARRSTSCCSSTPAAMASTRARASRSNASTGSRPARRWCGPVAARTSRSSGRAI